MIAHITTDKEEWEKKLELIETELREGWGFSFLPRVLRVEVGDSPGEILGY